MDFSIFSTKVCEKSQGPEVIELFLCSTQLSMKFQLLINTKIASNEGNFVLKLSEHAIYLAHKYEHTVFFLL